MDLSEKINTPEFKAQLSENSKKMSLSISEYISIAKKELSSTEWKEKLKELTNTKSLAGYQDRREEFSDYFRRELNKKYGQTSSDHIKVFRTTITKNDNLSNSKEYKILKEKFDREVKELKEKMEKNDKEN